MTKKENKSKTGNKSLLETARTKSFGVGKFALLSLKSEHQPPIKKVKIPVSTTNIVGITSGKLLDDRSNVSDITALSNGEDGVRYRGIVGNDHRQNGKPISNDIEVESSVFGMSKTSENSLDFSFSKAYIAGTTGPIIGNGDHAFRKQNAVQSKVHSTKKSASSSTVHYHLKSKNFAKPPMPIRKEATAAKKKTMDISKGLRFSAPAPMTLNRYQPQMGQEKTAPESKEYLEMKAKVTKQEQAQIEAKHMAEAKFAIEERLKEAFELDGLGEGSSDDRKNSLIKKLLGKVRPKSSKKLQDQQKSSAIQAAMAAAAAAVEAATGNPSGVNRSGNTGHISEEEARAIVNQALSESRQKKKSNMPELSGIMFHPSKVERYDNMATKGVSASINDLGRPIHFPVHEVMMRLNEDSVSDLDASIRYMRKLPVAEIRMNDSKQCRGDESVSTLGTPRVFEQLDKLLLSEPHRLQHQSGLVHNFLEDNMGGSAAPPPMVTSHDARALIDQLDSGTMVGDMTTGTARVENAVQFCNIAGNCFHPEHKSFLEDSARKYTIEDIASAQDELTFDDSETSGQEKSSNDGSFSSPNPEFTRAIDNAIRKAEYRVTTNQSGYDVEDEDAPFSSVEETRESLSPIASPYGSEVAVRESKSPSASPYTFPTSPRQEETANFDNFMNLAASRLDGMNPRGKSANSTTPRARGGGNKHLFGQKSSNRPFSEQQFDLLLAESSERNLTQNRKKVDKHLQINEHLGKNSSDGFSNQGRFLLEKDDAYWDTLSTIASTANERSSTNEQSLESDAYMDEFVQPGPIPGEITTSSSEMKSVSTRNEVQNFIPLIGDGISGEDTLKKNNRHLEQAFISKPDGSLNEMMNDVTDLIDSNLLDKLPISKTKRFIDPKSPGQGDGSDVIDPNESLRTSNQNTTRNKSNEVKPHPDTVGGSKLENTRSESLASHIAKGIRSVSWGFEEIYEDRNSHYDLSDQDTNNSEVSYNMTRKTQPYPEGVHRHQRRSSHSTDASSLQTEQEEDLLSRTLGLSKGLLETIMGSQLIREKEKVEEGRGISSDDAQLGRKNDEKGRNGYPMPTEYRDDFHDLETDPSETSEKDFSPMIHSRLEDLKNQRNRALTKFRLSQISAGKHQMAEPLKRDRDRLKYYTFNYSDGRSSHDDRIGNTSQSQSDGSDIELKYTTSDSNASTTPSQKARDLRLQLDQAMRASREIQISQNQLGNELNSFKKKYYKNPEIESYAKTTIRGHL